MKSDDAGTGRKVTVSGAGFPPNSVIALRANPSHMRTLFISDVGAATTLGHVERTYLASGPDGTFAKVFRPSEYMSTGWCVMASPEDPGDYSSFSITALK